MVRVLPNGMAIPETDSCGGGVCDGSAASFVALCLAEAAPAAASHRRQYLRQSAHDPPHRHLLVAPDNFIIECLWMCCGHGRVGVALMAIVCAVATNLATR